MFTGLDTWIKVFKFLQQSLYCCRIEDEDFCAGATASSACSTKEGSQEAPIVTAGRLQKAIFRIWGNTYKLVFHCTLVSKSTTSRTRQIMKNCCLTSEWVSCCLTALQQLKVIIALMVYTTNWCMAQHTSWKAISIVKSHQCGHIKLKYVSCACWQQTLVSIWSGWGTCTTRSLCSVLCWFLFSCLPTGPCVLGMAADYPHQ